MGNYHQSPVSHDDYDSEFSDASDYQYDAVSSRNKSKIKHDGKYTDEKQYPFEYQSDVAETVATPELKRGNKGRLSTLTTLVQDIKAVNNSKRSPSQRKFDAIFYEINHSETAYHDDEIDIGLGVVLYQLLKNILQYEHLYSEKNIEIVCGNLELVHRCSNLQREESFENIGIELINLLLEILDLCLSDSFKRKPNITTRKIVRIFGYFAIIYSAHVHMIDNAKFLDGLVKVILFSQEPKAQIDAVWTISNLAISNVARVKVLEHPDLLNSLLSISGRRSDMRSEVAAAFMNLTASPVNQEILVQNHPFLAALMRLLQTGKPESRSRAAGAIRNLASTKKNKRKLVSLDGGIIIDTLISAISNHMDDEKTCCRATGALKNIICHSNAEVLVRHRGLLAILGAVICDCKYPHAKNSASLALKDFMWEINHPSPSHKYILKFLIMTSKMTTKCDFGLFLSELFLIQVADESNQTAIVNNSKVLESLASLAYSQTKQTQENVAKALGILASEKGKRDGIQRNKAVDDAMKSVYKSKGAANNVYKSKGGQNEKISNREIVYKNMQPFTEPRSLLGAMANYATPTETNISKYAMPPLPQCQ